MPRFLSRSGRHISPGMSRPALRDAPSDVPRDTYPVVRITGEFFLRGIDLLTHIQSGGLVSGLIFMVVWYAYLRDPAKPAIATREIARRLAMPTRRSGGMLSSWNEQAFASASGGPGSSCPLPSIAILRPAPRPTMGSWSRFWRSCAKPSFGPECLLAAATTIVSVSRLCASSVETVRLHSQE